MLNDDGRNAMPPRGGDGGAGHRRGVFVKHQASRAQPGEVRVDVAPETKLVLTLPGFNAGEPMLNGARHVDATALQLD
jgi:hypothetical protein